ncbi:Nucleus export protein BRL1 [Candida viswanathii]|uniref:Nucleus export protein BRL1 n=1 Tax=Candida viswanathii TaxID=5486 RepID=A0A367Y9P7_9ASCO|nr:Nucleus export protein BRL1 [Candida viswanathii]
MAYNRSGIYTDFEDGALLLSLSLDDRPNRDTGLRVEEVYEDYEFIDDPMDIDNTEDLATRDETEDVTMDVDEGLPMEEHKKEEPEESASDDGLLALLSPTMMGAKLAIKKPLLLMPPPTREDEEVYPKSPEVDYEFDTSAYEPIRSEGILTQRTNSTSFQSTNINSFLPSRATPLPPTLGSFSEPYMDRQPPVTIHNHHHHYYYYNNQSGSSSKLDSLEEEKKQLQIEQYRQQIEQHRHYLEEYKRNNHLELPSPWQRNISPTERIPYMLMSYLQLIINFVASLYAVYLFYYLFRTISMDIRSKISQQQTNLMISIEACRRSYYQNGCDDAENLVPLLVSKCQKFERCMKQDPYKLSNVSLMSAEIIGMIINSLIEPLSLKFYIFVLGLGLVIFGCNFTFGYIRARAYYGVDK